MKAVGLVVEYNPFHFGHAYHLQEAKRISKANVVIAVMSGNFLQRGEPALISKWSRAKMALAAGVDIVIELPYSFATQKADTFAYGALTILNELKCHSFCFGSESGKIDDFQQTAAFFINKKNLIDQEVKKTIQTGISYPEALASSFKTVANNEKIVDLSEPNNMLGLQYVITAKKHYDKLQMLTIKRLAAQYHDQDLSASPIASATSIRKALFNNDQQLPAIEPYLPKTTFNELTLHKNHFKAFQSWESFWPYLQYKIISTNRSQLENIYEMEEGLHNRFYEMAFKSSSFEHFIQLVKTKRYTLTRLQRAATHLLTNTTKTEMKEHSDKVNYLRLLGFSDLGRQYLNEVKHHLNIPLISKLSSFPEKLIRLDLKAAQIYALGNESKAGQALINDEYKQRPFYLKDDKFI